MFEDSQIAPFDHTCACSESPAAGNISCLDWFLTERTQPADWYTAPCTCLKISPRSSKVFLKLDPSHCHSECCSTITWCIPVLLRSSVW